MTNPLRVTIMIPTYQQASVIGQAIDSALAQDYPHLEVIVADDASTDATGDVVAARKDPRLRYHRNPKNLGRVANYRHALYHHATGDWVVNLDGDDHYTDPAFIRAAIACVEKNPDLVLVAARHAGQPRPDSFRQAEGGVTVMRGEELLRRLHDPRYAFCHLATLYERRRAMACDFYRRNVLSSDWESLYRLALHGRIAYLNRDIGVWQVEPGNASQSTAESVLLENLQIWPSILDEAVARRCITSETRRRLLRRLYRSRGYTDLMILLRAGRTRGALHYFTMLRRLDRCAALPLLLHPRVIGRLLFPKRTR